MQRDHRTGVLTAPDGTTKYLASITLKEHHLVETTTHLSSDETVPPTSRAELAHLLTDRETDWTTRRLRLQGWRGTELVAAVRAGHAHRLAPGFCAVGAALSAVAGSVVLAFALAATAVVGMFARNHPVEMIYNAWAKRGGGEMIPRNKAAKRLGCALGTLMLGAAGLSMVLGADVLGRSIAGVFAGTAAFVAFTNLCIPSMVFTLLWGADRATCDRLV